MFENCLEFGVSFVFRLRKVCLIMQGEGLDLEIQPDWMDFNLLNHWKNCDWHDPCRVCLPASEERQNIDCDGVKVVPYQLKGNECKAAKHFFASLPC